ncbi:MAG TPA: SDR family oxidoreductase [Acidimicrobiales bacterium]|nr:SDR family oxidoreductase [Acidimicrobiales bacterium]
MTRILCHFGAFSPETPAGARAQRHRCRLLAALRPSLEELGWDRVDGVVHAIGFAPKACLGSGMFTAGWDDVSVALHVSAYSLKGLTEAVLPLLPGGAASWGLDFDASVAWPAYDWLSVAKAALESTSPLPGPRPRGAGHPGQPGGRRSHRTMAGKSIPGFDTFEQVWKERAPLGWDVTDAEPVALLRGPAVGLVPATTGEIVHVDGGFYAVGA